MPRLLNRNPAYRRHRASNQGVVTLCGKDFYLGPWNTAASKAEYDRLLSEWLAAGRSILAAASDLTVAELIAAFWKHAKSYYRLPDGSQSTELSAFKSALKHLRRLYGRTAAPEFGPLALEAVRNAMIAERWVRSSINKHCNRIRHVFKWAASREMISAAVPAALATLAGLRQGRSEAREGKRVLPVSDVTVDATLPFLSPVVANMVKLQRLTGARPGEICSMRTGDIDRTGDVWIYKPRQHKNQYRGHQREIYVGPRAQEILRPLLKLDPDAFIFSPKEAERQRREKLHAARKTPAGYGNTIGSNRKRRPQQEPGARYDTVAYNSAVSRACELAFPPPLPLGLKSGESYRRWHRRLTPKQTAELREWNRKHRWHVHQLRHSAATAVRAQFGLEAAAHVLGHASLDAAQIYAERSSEGARKVAGAIG
jgi:integrase